MTYINLWFSSAKSFYIIILYGFETGSEKM